MFKKSLLGLVLASTFAPSAFAADINFSGYGSIRGGMLLDDNFTLPEIFPYDDKMDFESESLFALQAQTKLNDKWSATVVMQAAGKKDFDLEARWAYVNYKYSPNTTLTFGRFAMPFFRSSDTKDIGYSHNFSRMPASVYIDLDAAVIEGIRASHTAFVGDGDITFKASYGSWDGEVRANGGLRGASEMNDILQLSAEYNWEWLSLFVGGFVGKWSSDLDAAVNAALPPGYSLEDGHAINPEGEAVYDMSRLYLDEDTAKYVSAGVAIDYNNFLFNAEIAHFGIDDSMDSLDDSYFVALGYRFDETVVSLVHQNREADVSLDQTDGLTDPVLKAYIDGFIGSIGPAADFTSNGVHVRYDIAPRVALKGEITNIQSDFVDEDVNLVTFGVDFVF